MTETITATDAQHDDDELTFKIVAFDPDSRPDVGGLVTIEDCDGNPINSEHKHKTGGVSREALAGHIPQADDRAVYSVEGILAMLRRLEFMEVDPSSYADLYWSQQDEH